MIESTRKIFVYPILALIVLMSACTATSIRPKYYILDYRPILQDDELKTDQPFPFKVQVQTMKIPRTFDRVNIVVRYSAHQLDYYRYRLWAIRPQITISDLIANHISSCGIFEQCSREFLDEQPDYEITGEILAIEQFENKEYSAAHLAMKLYLRSYDTYEILLMHEFDEEEEMPGLKMELFAKTLSDMLNEQMDQFILRMIEYFGNNDPGNVELTK
ncbi:membrane integrity-associated transporter subunit PqiC [candidate division KSB1 bacterium]|nr:membrane integrity-associated transporter subunit PqiC [candidate division KSB1 bacterium]